MNLKKLFFASALLFAACGTIQAQEVIAHRGFWTTDGSAQNSLAALVKADSIHCYGSEFDVWLTTDNQLVVNHDATFKGVTMQDATAKVCTAVQLDNGEQLPTLQQYLDKAKSPENPPYPRTESPQDSRTGNTSRRGYRKNDKGQRAGGPYGIYHLLPTCHQGIYPSGTQRYPRLLPDR